MLSSGDLNSVDSNSDDSVPTDFYKPLTVVHSAPAKAVAASSATDAKLLQHSEDLAAAAAAD